jgi:hypothetical protein
MRYIKKFNESVTASNSVTQKDWDVASALDKI